MACNISNAAAMQPAEQGLSYQLLTNVVLMPSHSCLQH
jgi:hypothetical protein